MVDGPVAAAPVADAALPRVSALVLCRDEKRFIARCLDSILRGDYPLDRLEILVVDGISQDGTRAIVEQYAGRCSIVRLVDNPKRITPAAFNVGITHATGDLIMPMSAHTVYPANYISGLVRWLVRTEADNVGGVLITCPASQTATARAIARGLSHPFGVGNAHFRLGSSGPRWVDTVPFGCYRREVFDRIGLFDEELVRNQDDELNHRLLQRGGRILLVPEVASRYYARGQLDQLWRMYYQYGYFKPLVMRKVQGMRTARPIVPALFVLVLLVSGILAPWSRVATMPLLGELVSYVAVAVACATAVAWREGVRVGLIMLIVFPVLHLAYGLGFLAGAVRFLLLRRTGHSAELRTSR